MKHVKIIWTLQPIVSELVSRRHERSEVLILLARAQLKTGIVSDSNKVLRTRRSRTIIFIRLRLAVCVTGRIVYGRYKTFLFV